MQNLKRNEHPSQFIKEEGFSKKPKSSSNLSSLCTKQLFIPGCKDSSLNISEYINWDIHTVSLVLTAKYLIGGCNLQIDEIEPLIKAQFNGSSLYNIVNDIKTLIQNRYKKSDQIEITLRNLNDMYNKEDSPQLSNTLKSIVYWVRNNLIDTNLETFCDSLIESDELIMYFSNILSQVVEDDKQFIENLISNENVESSASILLLGFGSDFKFVGRENVLNTFQSCYEEYSNALLSCNGKVISDKIVFPFIAAAPGIGKSRIMKEIGLSMFRKNNFFTLFTSFGNGTKFDVSSEFSPINSLCIRVLYSILCAITGKQGEISIFSKMKSLWKKFFDKRQVIDFETILIACKKLVSPNKEISFFLGIDEAHDIEKSIFDSIVLLLGQYMRQPTCGIVFPLFTGTYYTAIRNSLQSANGWAAQYIPVECMLPISNLDQIIDQLVLKYGKFHNWRIDIQFRYYLRKFGGFARGIEYYLEYLFKEDLNPKAAYEESKKIILRKYDVSSSLSSDIKKTILETILTRRVISKSDKLDKEPTMTWSYLEYKGLVMLEPVICRNSTNSETNTLSVNEFTVMYPQFIFSQVIPSYCRSIYDYLFESEDFAVISWVDVIHNYYYLVLQLLRDVKQLKLKELFPFALMNSSTVDLEID